MDRKQPLLVGWRMKLPAGRCRSSSWIGSIGVLGHTYSMYVSAAATLRVARGTAATELNKPEGVAVHDLAIDLAAQTPAGYKWARSRAGPAHLLSSTLAS